MHTRRLAAIALLLPLAAIARTAQDDSRAISARIRAELRTARAIPDLYRLYELRDEMPDLAPLGTRLARTVSVADPVPVAALAFRTLERSATAVSTVFALFEERAGVWLALVLIVGVVVWAVR